MSEPASPRASGGQHPGLRPWGGWRGLGLFWAVILVLVAGTVTTLQVLGPPERPAPAPPPAAATQAPPATPAPPPAPDPAAPGSPFLERAPRAIGGFLPRVAPDGRRPMQAFAAPFNPGGNQPRVAILLAGIGMNEADSLAAARALSGAVTFALSPYAANAEAMIQAVRGAGHEVLLAVPMEPTEFPLSDPGPMALMTSLSTEDNLDRLRRIMTLGVGYAGMTNALGGMRGERLSGMPDQMAMILGELGQRGLMFVDARPDATVNRLSWHRTVDLVIDESPTEDRIDQRLDLLARLARDRGAALGLATLPRPVTVERITAWINGLAARGIVLAPVTAIARPPVPREDSR